MAEAANITVDKYSPWQAFGCTDSEVKRSKVMDRMAASVSLHVAITAQF